MARWRWGLPISKSVDLPLGVLLYALGLILIVAYWFFCYRSFSLLMRSIKNARLVELDLQLDERRSNLRAQYGPPPESARMSSGTASDRAGAGDVGSQAGLDERGEGAEGASGGV